MKNILTIKIFLRTLPIVLCLFFNFHNILASTRTPMHYGTAYTDLYGPTNSNYSMGDFVRAVTDPSTNLPVYQKMTDASGHTFTIPYASDIALSDNALNLYNTLGYLYAGYAVFNVTPKTGINTFTWPIITHEQGWSNAAHCNQLAKHWINYRNPATNLVNNTPLYYPGLTCDENANPQCGNHPSLVELDNNIQCANTIWLVKNPAYYTIIAWRSQGNLHQGAQTNPTDALGGVSWGTNQTTNNYVLRLPNTRYAAPYGQFWGARLSHILGAVVNDVPSVNGSTTGTGTALPYMMPLNPGISPSPAPQIAILSGNAANWTYSNKNGTVTSNAPAGSITPSTAHFGTIKNYLSNMKLPRSVKTTSPLGKYYSYLQNHILQTVTRLASVCSYEISTSTDSKLKNLIHMKSENIGSITPYDQGVIVAIQNNTGNNLTVNQISTSSINQVGLLSATSTSNHFLHTASLMPASTATGSQNPVPGNMIEISDTTTRAAAYVQVVNGTQLENLVTNFNAALTAVNLDTENALLAKNNEAPITNLYFSYNQTGSSENYKPTGQYLLLTNFNTSTLSSKEENLMLYRMQAVDISQLGGVPFTITLQIDEKQSILYPSIVSIKTLLLQNLYDQNRSTPAAPYYNSIPLLLISETILNLDIPALKAHYGIWFLSYISALTEFMYTGDFGDRLGYMQNPIGLFDLVKQQPPARVVIDASGNLTSGAVLPLVNNKSASYQSEKIYMSLMGCDVIDIGSNYHHDIPILNLYTDAKSGSVVANNASGDWINLSVTCGTPASLSEEPKTFAQGYGMPYNNVMLFSLPAAAMKDGVIGELSQIGVKNYKLTFTDQNSKVLASQKVFLDASIKNPTSMNIQFLNSADTGWTSSTLIPPTVASVVTGKTQLFKLTYSSSGNKLKATVYARPVQLKTLTTVQALESALHDAGISNISTLKVTATANPLQYFNINIGSNIGYAFFSNPWGNSQVVPGFDFTDIAQSDWQSGVQVIVLGLDQNGGIISDLTQKVPKIMVLFVYNAKGNTLLKTIQFDPLKNADMIGKKQIFDTNNQQFGSPGFVSAVQTYPTIYTIKCPKPAPKIVKPVSSKKTKKITPVVVEKKSQPVTTNTTTENTNPLLQLYKGL